MVVVYLLPEILIVGHEVVDVILLCVPYSKVRLQEVVQTNAVSIVVLMFS